VTGRVIEQRTDVSANTSIQLGSRYRPGVYIATVTQGKEKVTLRIIKGRE
jgi:transposase-like protein